MTKHIWNQYPQKYFTHKREEALLCNAFSHWPIPYPEWSLQLTAHKACFLWCLYAINDILNIILNIWWHYSNWLPSSTVTFLKKKINSNLAKQPLKFNGSLAKLGLTSLLKQATELWELITEREISCYSRVLGFLPIIFHYITDWRHVLCYMCHKRLQFAHGLAVANHVCAH